MKPRKAPWLLIALYLSLLSITLATESPNQAPARTETETQPETATTTTTTEASVAVDPAASPAPLESYAPHASPSPSASPTSYEYLCHTCGAPVFHAVDAMSHLPTDVHTRQQLLSSNHDPATEAEGLYRFVNPAGVRQELKLFREASGVKHDSLPSTSNSYFPPLAWSKLICSSCNAHLGFKFMPPPPPSSDKSKKGKRSGRGKTSTSSSSASSSDSSTQGSPPSKPRQAIARTYSEAQEDTLMKSLNNLCLAYPNGWWTIKWCHKDKVTQLHYEADKTVSMEWSMGSYDFAGKVTRVKPVRAPGYFHTHNFIDGQFCDETKTHRRTEVHFFCCTTSQRLPHIQSYEELALCKYRLTICVPELCVPEVEQLPQSSSSGSSSGSFSDSSTSSTKTREEQSVSTTPRPTVDPISNIRPFYAMLTSSTLGDQDPALAAISGDYTTGLNAPWFYFG